MIKCTRKTLCMERSKAHRDTSTAGVDRVWIVTATCLIIGLCQGLTHKKHMKTHTGMDSFFGLRFSIN